MIDIGIKRIYVAEAVNLDMDINEYLEYQMRRIKVLEKEVLVLEKELHKSAMQILVNDPIFEQPIKK